MLDKVIYWLIFYFKYLFFELTVLLITYFMLLQNSYWILRYNINKKYENWITFKQKVISSFEPAKTKYWILPSTPHSRVGETEFVFGVYH